MVGYGKSSRIQQEECNLFNMKYSNTLSHNEVLVKLRRNLKKLDKHVANAGTRKNDIIKIYIILSVTENLQINSRYCS